jgi:hypothetical protein
MGFLFFHTDARIDNRTEFSMKKYTSLFLVLLALACFTVLPVSAVIQEVTVKGTISGLDVQKNSATIADPNQYGCVYPATGPAVCSYTPMTVTSLSGTVPDPAVFSTFRTGDPVVATSLGGAGETWIAIAKLFGSSPDQAYVIDIIGDATTIPTPIAGNYTLDLSTNPDCNTCSGTTCTAASSNTVIVCDGMKVAAKTLKPGEYLSFNGKNDGSSISVTFVKGQAPASACQKQPAGFVGGVQPVSDYNVHVTPPIGMTISQVEETNAVPSIVSTVTATPAPSSPPAQTQKSASLPFIVIGALCLVMLVLGFRRT